MSSKNCSVSNSFWTIDPIDGTKGYIRNDQYAICLAFVHEEKVLFGALACPAFQQGIIQYAISGKGAFVIPFPSICQAKENFSYDKQKVEANLFKDDFSNLITAESFDAGHCKKQLLVDLRHKLGIGENNKLEIDGQVKYAAVAQGNCDLYIRASRSASYKEKIWDHASGILILQEAGGVVSDFCGEPVNFKFSSTLEINGGIVASSNAKLHEIVLNALRSCPS